MSLKTQCDVSAGGVIYRTENNEIMVCLIKTPPNGDWQLPKGLVDDNESFEQTALREVKEETGLEGILEDRIDSIDYSFWQEEGDEKIRHHKTVYFFLLKFRTGVTDDHDDEVFEAVWMPLANALDTLTFDGEREILRKAEQMLRSGNQGENVNRKLICSPYLPRRLNR